ncbi:fimbrial protein [Rouxiella sp. WC2420]|uniref:Fimbrial protein n=1 Tax=Rouxiella sp. WC2420 TaxID=3234145 RepID=A0AB39VR80_9GAMM
MSFNIKKTSVLSVATAALLATCWGAQAAGNIAAITVSAEVSESTCQLTSPDNTLPLGSYSSAAFGKKAGKDLGAKEFSLELHDCGTAVKTAHVNVDGEVDPVDATAFKNTFKNGASGVAVVIEGGTPLAKIIPKSKADYTLAKTESQSLKFNAKLISTSATVTPGKIEAPITFTVTYN